MTKQTTPTPSQAKAKEVVARGAEITGKASIATVREAANILANLVRSSHDETNWERVKYLSNLIHMEASKEVK